MIINTLAAMCAGVVLNFIFGAPKGFLNAKNLVTIFSDKLEKLLRRFYDTAPDAQRMAGAVLVFFTLLVISGIPLALLIFSYMYIPIVGLLLDCLFCYMAFSVRDVRNSLTAVFRGVKNNNPLRARKGLKAITNDDCSELESDDLVRKAVECSADTSCDDGAGVLFFMFLAGGFGGLFYRSLSVLSRKMKAEKEEYVDFGNASRTLWRILNFIPSLICTVIMMLDISFLHLDSKNAKTVLKADRKKTSFRTLGFCRSLMAGALKIQLLPDEKTGKTIGTQIKSCEATMIYWANQIMYGTVFGCFIFFAIIRIALAIFI